MACVAVAAASLATAVGVVAKDGPVWLAVVVGSVALLAGMAAPIIIDRYFHHQDAALTARQARTHVMVALRPPDPGPNGAGLTLLQPTRCPTPFWGRTHERRRMAAWRDSPDRVDVIWLVGAGGVGKSRLALRFAEESSPQWVSGWLRSDRIHDALDVIGSSPDDVLLLVDDADLQPTLHRLLDAVARYTSEGRLRVVLIARDMASVRAVHDRRLTAEARRLTRATQVAVSPHGGIEDRRRWFVASVEKFARHLGVPTPPYREQELAEREADEPILVLLAQALLTVVGAPSVAARVRAEAGVRIPDIIDGLLLHEAAWWERSSGEPHWQVQDFRQVDRDRALTVLGLLGTRAQEQGVASLGLLPGFQSVPHHQVRRLADWVYALYPESAGSGLIRPQALADWFVVSRLLADRELARFVLDQLGGEAAKAALAALARSVAAYPAALDLLVEVIRSDAGKLLPVAVEVTVETAQNLTALDEVLARTIEQRTPPAGVVTRVGAIEIPDRLPLVQLALAVCRTRQTEDEVPEEEILADLAFRQSMAGLRSQAASTAARVVKVLRGKGESGVPYLAAALVALAGYLRDAWQFEQARDVADEAVGISLRAGVPHVVALARTEQAWCLAETGRYPDALRVAAESGGPPAVIAEIIARASGALNDWTTCIDSAKRAVELWSAERDDRYVLPELARATADLAGRQKDGGFYRDALTSSQVAAELWSDLADMNPARHTGDYGAALYGLAMDQRLAGMSREAVRTAGAAVPLLTTAAEREPARYRPDLGRSLDCLAGCLHDLGRGAEAFGAAQRALHIFTELHAQDSVGRFTEQVAHSRGAFAILLAGKGRAQEARSAFHDSLRVLRGMGASRTRGSTATLAVILHNYGNFLHGQQEHEAELSAYREEVEVLRAQGADDPEADSAYRTALSSLQKEYERHGFPEEAIRLGVRQQSPRR